MRGLEALQLSLELAGVDRADERVDHLRELQGLADRQLALRDGGGDRLHRGVEVGGAADRRQLEPDRPLAPGTDDAAEAEPLHDSVAALRVVDRPPQQRARLAIEHFFSNYGGAIACARPLPRRMPDRPFINGLPGPLLRWICSGFAAITTPGCDPAFSIRIVIKSVYHIIVN